MSERKREEAKKDALGDHLTERVIGAAIEVHRALGPGLLESAYEQCLCRELELVGLPFERQVPLPVEYKGVKLDCGYRMDLVVSRALVVELKTADDSSESMRRRCSPICASAESAGGSS